MKAKFFMAGFNELMNMTSDAELKMIKNSAS